MVISMKEMYLGETAEIISVCGNDICVKRLRDMGLREGKLFDLLHYDHLRSRKTIIIMDNSKIAFDAELADRIKVRPLKSYYETFRTHANYDSLTGCMNRRTLECVLMREHEKFVSNRIPLSVLLSDIDYFKRINDTYGHGVGDSVLVNISVLFKQLLRRSDCLCRWGGEEFLMLLRGTSLGEALRIAERLRQSIESHIFNPFKGSGFVTVSIGGCGMPPYKHIENIIEAADAALYSAKRNGRNRVTVCEGML